MTPEAETGETRPQPGVPRTAGKAQRLGGAGGTLPGDALTLDSSTLPGNEFLVLSPQLVAICSGSFQGAGPRPPAGTLGWWVPGSLGRGSYWPSLAKTDPA